MNRDPEKVFVVSNNKCGTTSLRDFFLSIGWSVGAQKAAEILYYDELLNPESTVASSDWVEYVSSAQVFQDVPFSTPRFLPWLVNHYPEAFFIHVSRPAEEWYRSLIGHHISRRLSIQPALDATGSLMWSAGLQDASEAHPYRGIALHKIVCGRYGTDQEDPYQKSALVAQHEFQQKQARILLQGRNSLLLDLHELKDEATSEILSKRLGLETVFRIPHSNSN